MKFEPHRRATLPLLRYRALLARKREHIDWVRRRYGKTTHRGRDEALSGHRRRFQEGFDKKLLGQKLPGSETERAVLLEWLQEIVEKKGDDWVKRHKGLLLAQAESCVEMGLGGV